MSKYIWVMQTNSGDLIPQIDKDENEVSFKLVLEHEKRDELDRFHLANETNIYAVNLRTGYFYINDLPFYPCAEILDISRNAKKDLEFLSIKKLEEMKKLSKLKLFENKEDIDQLSERQLKRYRLIKSSISIIEKELTSLKYRLVYYKRHRAEKIINTDIPFKPNDSDYDPVISSKKYLYGYLIGWQTTFFGKNYQRFMFISELYDDVFEIRSKR